MQQNLGINHTMHLKLITEAGNLKGKRVLVRSSCNVPLDEGSVRNSFRLRRALPTLQYLQAQGARVIVISHIGRDHKDTLLPVFTELSKSISMRWGGAVTDESFAALAATTQDGDILFWNIGGRWIFS